MTDDVNFHGEVNVGGALFEPIKGELCAAVNRADENTGDGHLRAYFLGTFLYAKKVPARRVGGSLVAKRGAYRRPTGRIDL